MLEPYALKSACTVLRGGGGGNLTSLPDRSRLIKMAVQDALEQRKPQW